MSGLWYRTRPRVEVLEDRTLLSGTGILWDGAELPTHTPQESALHATPPADDQGSQQTERADSAEATKEPADQTHTLKTHFPSDDGVDRQGAAAAPSAHSESEGDRAASTGQRGDGSESAGSSTHAAPNPWSDDKSDAHDDSGPERPGAPSPTTNQSDDGKSTAGHSGTGTSNSKDDRGDDRTPPRAISPKASPPSAVGVAQANNAAVAADVVHSAPQSRSPSSGEADISVATNLQRMDDPSPSKEGETAGTNRFDAFGMPTTSSNYAGGNTLTGQTLVASAAEEPLSTREIEIEEPPLNPQAADLLVSLPALGVDTVQEAMQSFLRKLDSLGSAVISSPEGMVLSFWVLCAFTMAAGCEIVRRQMRRDRQGLLVASTDDPLLAWFPEGRESLFESGK